MKGGFERIALGLLQVLDRAIDLKPRRRTDDLVAVRIDGNQSHLTHRAVARTRQKHGHDEKLFSPTSHCGLVPRQPNG